MALTLKMEWVPDPGDGIYDSATKLMVDIPLVKNIYHGDEAFPVGKAHVPAPAKPSTKAAVPAPTKPPYAHVPSAFKPRRTRASASAITLIN